MSYLKKRKMVILLSAFVIMSTNQISSAKWIPVDEYRSEKTNAKIDLISKNKDRKGYCGNDHSETQKIILNITTSGVETIDVTSVETLNNTRNKVTYQMLDVPGVTTSSPEVGKPNIPVKVFMHEIPFGSVFDVNVESVEKKLIKNINVYPTQKEVPESSNKRSEFSKDQNTYSSSQLFPENFLLKSETITMRNHQFIRLEVALAKCRPADKELQLVSSMKIVIELKNDSKKPMNFNESRSFNQLFSSVNSTTNLIQNRIGGTPEKYMILMDDQFSDNSALNDFIEWKSRKGYDVNVVKTSQINNSGAPDSSQIQRFMLSIPDSLYPTYLLIIGDETAENGVDGWFRCSDYGAYEDSSRNYFGFTDLYYTIRDTCKGFPVPDLFYGRIPAKNNNELTVMLQKAVNMDRTPPRNNMFNKILVAGMLQDDTTMLPWYTIFPDNIADRLFCETADAVASYFEIDPKNVGYTCTRSFVKGSTVDSNCLWNSESILWNYTDKIGSRIYDQFLSGTVATARISSQINNGVSVVFHRDHGKYT
ncbi:MAG: C25 family cysteine peptidase, partial [Fibrobacter sp.]|nr:C25 family cysteine peptidase [Fibrobacter sp.]